MNLQFGDYILDLNVDQPDMEDLLHSKANKLSTELVKSIKDQVVVDIRTCVANNNIIEASKLNGYLTCLEDLEEMFSVHLEVAIKDQ